jgi:hypothetical protein
MSGHSSRTSTTRTKTMQDTGHEHNVDSVPWRYRCPHCNASGHALRRRYKRIESFKNCKEVDDDRPFYEKNHDPVEPSEIADYYCDSCQTPVEEPIDKKNE